MRTILVLVALTFYLAQQAFAADTTAVKDGQGDFSSKGSGIRVSYPLQ